MINETLILRQIDEYKKQNLCLQQEVNCLREMLYDFLKTSVDAGQRAQKTIDYLKGVKNER